MEMEYENKINKMLQECIDLAREQKNDRLAMALLPVLLANITDTLSELNQLQVTYMLAALQAFLNSKIVSVEALASYISGPEEEVEDPIKVLKEYGFKIPK